MRKVSIVTSLVLSAVFAATPCFATPMADMVLGGRRVHEYGTHFLNNNRTGVNTTFLRATSAEEREVLRGLGGDPQLIDTPLEIALLSRSAGVTNIRPVEATQVISDRDLDLVLGAFLFKEIAVLRFLQNHNAVGIREGLLEHNVIAHGNVTRAEIEVFYRNSIRGFVNEIVDDASAHWSPPAPLYIAEIKQIVTGFLLNPSTATYNVMRDAMNRYNGMGGHGDRQSAMVFVSAIGEFNSEIANALVDNRVIASAGQPTNVVFGVGGGE